MSRSIARAIAPTAPHESPAEPFVVNVTRGVLEALAGVRQVEQLARWFDEDAYVLLVNRAALSQRARLARGLTPKRPPQAISTVMTCAPTSDALEATIILAGAERTRAAALRLERFVDSWRVTSFTIL